MSDPRSKCPIKCPRKREDIASPKLRGVGSLNASIMFVGEAPGQTEDKEGEPFVGPSGEFLDEILLEFDIKRADVYITNAVRCAKAKENKTPKKKEITLCRKYLVKEIKKIQPNVICAMGGVALEAVLKRTGITKLKNNVFYSDEFNTKVIPIFHPAHILRNPGNLPFFRKGMELVVKEAGSRKILTKPKTTRHIDANTPKQIDKVLSILEKKDAFVFDLETTSLNYLDADILCIAFSWKKELGITIKWGRLTESQKERLYKILKAKKLKIGHNVKYDMQVLLHNKIKIRGSFFDTLLAMHLIDENIKEKTLDALTLHYLDMGEYWKPLEDFKTKYARENKIKKDDITYDLIPYKILAPYAQCDADATYRLYQIFKKELKRQKLTHLFKRYTIPTMRMLLELEYRGIKVDRPKLEKLIKKYHKKLDKARAKIYNQDIVTRYTKLRKTRTARNLEKHWEQAKTLKSRFPDVKEYIKSRSKSKAIIKECTFNANSPKQLGEILFDLLKLKPIKFTDTNQPSTDEEVLTTLAEEQNIPIAKDIIAHRKLAKYISTYMQSTYDKSEFDGRIHANYMQFVAVSGRLSCEKPNMQNIKRDAYDFKECFVADPGYVFLKGDLAQAEFRCWAHYADDKDMIADIESGMDIHRLVASRAIYGIPEEEITKDQRTAAKNLTFGLIYGRGSKSAAAQYGITIEQADAAHEFFFELYPVATNWLHKIVAHARTYGYVKTWMGRIRRLPDIDSNNPGVRAEAERQAKNSPIQGLASNMNDHYMVQTLKQARKKGIKCYPAATQHDAQIYQVKKSHVKKLVKVMNHVVATAFPDFRCKMKLDFEIGDTLGTLKEIA